MNRDIKSTGQPRKPTCRGSKSNIRVGEGSKRAPSWCLFLAIGRRTFSYFTKPKQTNNIQQLCQNHIIFVPSSSSVVVRLLRWLRPAYLKRRPSDEFHKSAGYNNEMEPEWMMVRVKLTAILQLCSSVTQSRVRTVCFRAHWKNTRKTK